MTETERKEVIAEIVLGLSKLGLVSSAPGHEQAESEVASHELKNKEAIDLKEAEKDITITELSSCLNSLADVVMATANRALNLNDPQEFQYVISALECISRLTNQAAAMAQILDGLADITDFRLIPSVW